MTDKGKVLNETNGDMASRSGLLLARQLGGGSSSCRVLGKRMQSTVGENAFVKQRREVKEHAGGSVDLWRRITL